jgi:hypothetical protein
MTVYLLLLTNDTDIILNHTNLLQVLKSYPNVRIRFVNLTEFTQGTKMEKFFSENRVKNSPYRLEHTSDVLRMLVLNKYGGLYLDLDVISLYPVRLMRSKNFVCLEGNNVFANAILMMDLIEGRKYSDVYFE